MFTFSHVPVPRDRAALIGRMAHPPSGEADQADSPLQFSLPLQPQQGDVVVQRLAVVVVVNVRCGHAQGLRTRRPILASQVMVADTHIDRITGTDNATNRNYFITTLQ